MYKGYASEHSTLYTTWISTIVTDGLRGWSRWRRCIILAISCKFCKTTQNITECNATSAQHVSANQCWNSWPLQGSQLYPCGISLLRITLKKCKRLSEDESHWNSSEDESRLNLQEKGAILDLKNLTKQNCSILFQISSINGDTAQERLLPSSPK